MLESLRGDPRYGAHATDEAVERNRDLLFDWDGLSLAFLHGVQGRSGPAATCSRPSTAIRPASRSRPGPSAKPRSRSPATGAS